MVAEARGMCADPEETSFWIDDARRHPEHLLAAHAMGLGGCGSGYTTAGVPGAVREILRLPANLAVHCLIAVGPAEIRLTGTTTRRHSGDCARSRAASAPGA